MSELQRYVPVEGHTDLVRDTTSSGDSGIDIADIGTLKSVTGFTTGDLIVPVIYDPDASDGTENIFSLTIAD